MILLLGYTPPKLSVSLFLPAQFCFLGNVGDRVYPKYILPNLHKVCCYHLKQDYLKLVVLNLSHYPILPTFSFDSISEHLWIHTTLLVL